MSVSSAEYMTHMLVAILLEALDPESPDKMKTHGGRQARRSERTAESKPFRTGLRSGFQVVAFSRSFHSGWRSQVPLFTQSAGWPHSRRLPPQGFFPFSQKPVLAAVRVPGPEKEPAPPAPGLH